MAKPTFRQGIELLKTLSQSGHRAPQIVQTMEALEHGTEGRSRAQAIIEKREVIKPAQFFVGLTERLYDIVVESIASPSRDDLSRTYDRISGVWWDQRNYPVQLHESLYGLKPTPGTKVILAKQFDDKISNKQAIEWARRHGARLLFPCERETFVRAHKAALGHDSIDLGSYVYVSGAGRFVPFLCTHIDALCVQRTDFWIDEAWFDLEQGPTTRFLFAMK